MGVSDVIWECLNNISQDGNILREAQQLVRECHQYKQSDITVCCATKIIEYERELEKGPPTRISILLEPIDSLVYDYLWPDGHA